MTPDPLPDWPRMDERSRDLGEMFHHLWSLAVGTLGYDKAKWMALERLIDAEIERARREEREACARIVDARRGLWNSHGGASLAGPYSHLTIEGECEVIAAAIRARSEVKL